MKHLLNQAVQGIQISGIRKFSNLVAQYPDAISLTIGQPDFPTPAHIKEAAKIAVDQNRTQYTPNAGLLEARVAACDFMKMKYRLSYDSSTEVIITNGASEAIDTALRTILTPGSEVILPGPIYPGYEPIIRLCGAVPVFVDTTTSEFKLQAVDLEAAITERTRCVILPYPSNPTGCTLDYEDLKALVKVLEKRDLFVLSDEIYSELVYDQAHASIAQFAQMREKTIVINGLSKSHSMTGWRIGFTFAPAYITEQMLKVHQYNTTCASSISQYAAIEALTVGINDACEMRAQYEKRRDYVLERLIKMGLPAIKPSGAFYLFPSIQSYGKSSSLFASSLLEKARVAVVPGDAFSIYGEGYVRISYAYAPEILEEAMNRLERFLQ